MLTKHPAETIGWLDQKLFWKARGDHVQFTLATIACVFKKFMSRLPDGTTLVQKVALNGGMFTIYAKN
jgi:hypothetical protein